VAYGDASEARLAAVSHGAREGLSRGVRLDVLRHRELHSLAEERGY
jgi:hypothetical protein